MPHEELFDSPSKKREKTRLKVLRHVFRSFKTKCIKMKNNGKNQKSKMNAFISNTLKRRAKTCKTREAGYEVMTSNFGTLPKSSLPYNKDQSMSERSLDNIIDEAKKEIIECSENEDVYVTASKENIYEEVNFKRINKYHQNEGSITFIKCFKVAIHIPIYFATIFSLLLLSLVVIF